MSNVVSDLGYFYLKDFVKVYSNNSKKYIPILKHFFNESRFVAEHITNLNHRVVDNNNFTLYILKGFKKNQYYLATIFNDTMQHNSSYAGSYNSKHLPKLNIFSTPFFLIKIFEVKGSHVLDMFYNMYKTQIKLSNKILDKKKDDIFFNAFSQSLKIYKLNNIPKILKTCKFTLVNVLPILVKLRNKDIVDLYDYRFSGLTPLLYPRADNHIILSSLRSSHIWINPEVDSRRLSPYSTNLCFGNIMSKLEYIEEMPVIENFYGEIINSITSSYKNLYLTNKIYTKFEE